MSLYNARPLEYIDGVLAQRCCVCKEIKSFEEFHRSPDKKFGRASTCRPCTKERGRLWRAANSEKDKRAKRAWHLAHQDDHRRRGWKGYGIDITPEEYQVRLRAQGSRCKICTRPASEFKRRLAPDHDHKTGKVRGLLCGNCNTGLGQFRDNPELLGTAISYLRGQL